MKIGIYNQVGIPAAIPFVFPMKKAKTTKDILYKNALIVSIPLAGILTAGTTIFAL